MTRVNQRTVFSELVTAFAKSKNGDIFRTTIGDSLVVPERTRALSIAISASQHQESTLLVVTPTISGAQTLASDLTAFIDARDVELLPCWETLPFERVSPTIETMGIRSRVITRMSTKTRPKVVVGSARAICQKIAKSFE